MNKPSKEIMIKVMSAGALVLLFGGMSWAYADKCGELTLQQKKYQELQIEYDEVMADATEIAKENVAHLEELKLRDKVLEEYRTHLDQLENDLKKLQNEHKECPTKITPRNVTTANTQATKVESDNSNTAEKPKETLTTNISFGVDSKVTTIRIDNGGILDKGLMGKLKGHGWSFVNAGKKYGIDPLFLAAIAAQESGWGEHDHGRNNIFGISSGAKSFSSVAECIDYTARLLRNNYVNQGLDTPAKIQPKYCPSPTNWHHSIVNCAKSITKRL